MCYTYNTKPFAEIETRIGILKSSYIGPRDMRVLSSGPKRLEYKGETCIANAFVCSPMSHGVSSQSPLFHSHPLSPRYQFENGVTRSHFTNWTTSGISEPGPISQAFGIRNNDATSSTLRRELIETELSETVYSGYPQEDQRVCITGDGGRGRMEHKSKLNTMDVALPSAPYDVRLTLATERILDERVAVNPPPSGWTHKRVKHRRSYTRRDKSFAWQLDVTEATSTRSNGGWSLPSKSSPGAVQFEIELELNTYNMLRLVNELDEVKTQKLISELAQQLWWMLGRINPSSDVLDANEFLQNHSDAKEVSLAIAQCAALQSFADGCARGNKNTTTWYPAIAQGGGEFTVDSNSSSQFKKKRFPGSMPVNFSRHDIDRVQRSNVDSGDCGYFLSEKTDGVRHLLVFTGKTAVLIDRAMKGKQPRQGPSGFTSTEDGEEMDPMSHILPLIQPGTVLDGEVVMHRMFRRPVFIVFDVLCLSAMQPILHLPFAQRLRHLRQASFRMDDAKVDMFADSTATSVNDPNIALPLIRKNFVRRTWIDELFLHVIEERGRRFYRHGDGVHNHLTDGIIFQPNTPYVCGTDVNLLKWKYLDTVTIDVILMDKCPKNHAESNENILHYNDYGNHFHEEKNGYPPLLFSMLGDEGMTIDVTRHVLLPTSERLRLEADRHATNYESRIVEVGFDPNTGEWYYSTMRPDKVQPNHVSTVLGSLLELAERLDAEELRYRMMIDLDTGVRDSYRKDVRKMKRQLLDHQREMCCMRKKKADTSIGN